MKIVKLTKIHNGPDSYAIQLPSGRILGLRLYNTRQEAQAVLDTVLSDAAELVAQIGRAQ